MKRKKFHVMIGSCIRFVLSFGCCFWLTGCETEADEALSQYIHRVESRTPRAIPPIPEVVPLQKFVYPENEERRSPFKPKNDSQSVSQDAPNTHRVREPLEAYPLDALKFVGILKQGNVIWALIKQPDGVVAIVKVGDYMGKNYGKVIQISDTSLKLEETVQVEGKWEKKMTVFNLSANE